FKIRPACAGIGMDPALVAFALRLTGTAFSGGPHRSQSGAGRPECGFRRRQCGVNRPRCAAVQVGRRPLPRRGRCGAAPWLRMPIAMAASENAPGGNSCKPREKVMFHRISMAAVLTLVFCTVDAANAATYCAKFVGGPERVASGERGQCDF